jgi:hypothetical protein
MIVRIIISVIPIEAEIPLVRLSETFERDDITISLEWNSNQSDYDIVYNVSISPQPATDTSIESGRMNVTVYYNTHYNVSIYAAPPCGEYNLTEFLEFYYGKVYICESLNRI